MIPFYQSCFIIHNILSNVWKLTRILDYTIKPFICLFFNFDFSVFVKHIWHSYKVVCYLFIQTTAQVRENLHHWFWIKRVLTNDSHLCYIDLVFVERWQLHILQIINLISLFEIYSIVIVFIFAHNDINKLEKIIK